MAVWPSGYGVRLRLHFFARAWCCCWFVVRWFTVYSRCQIMAAADFFFFPSEQTSFFSSCRFQNKFRENPSSPSAVRVVVDTKYNTHTHSINNTTTTTTCRTTKVAVPLPCRLQRRFIHLCKRAFYSMLYIYIRA